MEAATMAIGISRLGQVAINVHDVDRATAFYRDKLGLLPVSGSAPPRSIGSSSNCSRTWRHNDENVFSVRHSDFYRPEMKYNSAF